LTIPGDIMLGDGYPLGFFDEKRLFTLLDNVPAGRAHAVINLSQSFPRGESLPFRVIGIEPGLGTALPGEHNGDVVSAAPADLGR
jgi:hypothetical protein